MEKAEVVYLPCLIVRVASHLADMNVIPMIRASKQYKNFMPNRISLEIKYV